MPRRHVHELRLDVDRERLFRTLADVESWPAWDPGIEGIDCGGVPSAGTRFRLRPKGGPAVTMTIETLEAPSLFADLAHLPLARMRSRHELLPTEDGGTVLRHVIETVGPLAWLWDRLLVRKIADDLPHQAERMAAFARQAQFLPVGAEQAALPGR
jgi:hypothetical protein